MPSAESPWPRIAPAFEASERASEASEQTTERGSAAWGFATAYFAAALVLPAGKTVERSDRASLACS